MLRFAMLLLALGLAASACGGASPPGVASDSATTVAPAPAGGVTGDTGTETAYLDGVKYSACTRSHGVTNFPDPDNKGQFINDRGLLNGQKVDQGSAMYATADKACQHLLPNDGKPTAAQLQQMMANALKTSECMRAHGITKFPDPVEEGGGVAMVLGGHIPNSPVFRAAARACHLGAGAS